MDTAYMKERNYRQVMFLRYQNEREERMLQNKLYSKHGAAAIHKYHMAQVEHEENSIRKEIMNLHSTTTTTWGFLPPRPGKTGQKAPPKSDPFEKLLAAEKMLHGKKTKSNSRSSPALSIHDLRMGRKHGDGFFQSPLKTAMSSPGKLDDIGNIDFQKAKKNVFNRLSQPRKHVDASQSESPVSSKPPNGKNPNTKFKDSMKNKGKAFTSENLLDKKQAFSNDKTVNTEQGLDKEKRFSNGKVTPDKTQAFSNETLTNDRMHTYSQQPDNNIIQSSNKSPNHKSKVNVIIVSHEQLKEMRQKGEDKVKTGNNTVNSSTGDNMKSENGNNTNNQNETSNGQNKAKYQEISNTSSDNLKSENGEITNNRNKTNGEIKAKDQENSKSNTNDSLYQSNINTNTNDGTNQPDLEEKSKNSTKSISFNVAEDNKRPRALTPIRESAAEKELSKNKRVNKQNSFARSLTRGSSFFSSSKGSVTKKKAGQLKTEPPETEEMKLNPDGSLRTVYQLPDFQKSIDDAQNTRYLRMKTPVWYEREISVSDIWKDKDKPLKQKLKLK